MIRISSAWDRSTRPIETPNVVGLEDGEHEPLHLGHTESFVHGDHGISTAGSGSGLPQHAGELVRQCTRDRLDDPVQRLFEAQARLDADRQQVEHVGQGPLHGLLTSLDLAVQGGIGAQDQRGTDQQPGQDLHPTAEGQHVQEEHDEGRRNGHEHRQHPADQESVQLLVGHEPGQLELGLDLLDVARRREPATDVDHAVGDGEQGALPQGVEHLLLAEVLGLVALELTERAANDRPLLGLGGDRVDHQADGGSDSGDCDEEHDDLRRRCR